MALRSEISVTVLDIFVLERKTRSSILSNLLHGHLSVLLILALGSRLRVHYLMSAAHLCFHLMN